MREKFEIVCNNCSELFLSEDEEMTLCPKCWKAYVENQLRA
jgi:Zn finger protein HypA/HybF involved in hydrogenase expression